ncbi:hypothetical protein TNCV_4681651 [Trichonephila clavipes]|nr:hypothetical protein TNCV_4681651 [Trichonephila clavipes]
MHSAFAAWDTIEPQVTSLGWWEAPDCLQGVLPRHWGGTELNRSVTCMLLKATANDRRTSSPFAAVNFVGIDPTPSDSRDRTRNLKRTRPATNRLCHPADNFSYRRKEGRFVLGTFRSERMRVLLPITPRRQSSRDVGTSSYIYHIATYSPASVSANSYHTATIQKRKVLFYSSSTFVIAYGHCVAGARVRCSRKTRRVKKLMHIKAVEAQNLRIGVVWKFVCGVPAQLSVTTLPPILL